VTRPVEDLGTRVVDAVYAGLGVDDEWSVRQERGFEWWPHRSSQRVWSDEPELQPSGETTWLLHSEAACAEVPPDYHESMRQVDAVLSAFGRRLSMTAIFRTEDGVMLHATVVAHEGNVDWLERVFQVVVLSQARVAMKAATILSAVFGLEPPESEHPSSGQRPEPDQVLGALDNPPHAEDWSHAEFGRAADYLTNAGILAMADVAGLTAEFPIKPDGPPAILGGATVMPTAQAETREDGCQLRLTLRLPSWPRDGDEVQIFPVDLNEMEASGESGTHLAGSWAANEEDPAAPPFFTSVLPPVLSRPGLLTNLVLATAVRARWVSDFIEPPALMGSGPLPDLDDEGFRAGFVEFLQEYLTDNEEAPVDEDPDSGCQIDGLIQQLGRRIRALGPVGIGTVIISSTHQESWVSGVSMRVPSTEDDDHDDLQDIDVDWDIRDLRPIVTELVDLVGGSFAVDFSRDGAASRGIVL
jgi:hypothetical protein